MLSRFRATSKLRSAEMIRMLVAAGKMPRVAMAGTSMLPLLHEPMILRLKPARVLRVGDIIAFEQGGKIVAHRVIVVQRGAVRTSGDATPETVESVEPAAIVGLVAAIYADGRSRAKRMDRFVFRARGHWLARTRRLRCFFIRLRRTFDAAAPWRRPRSFAALIGMLAAIERRDPRKLATALWDVDAQRVAETAERHRCVGFLLDGMHDLGRGDWDDHALSRLMQPIGRSIVMRSFALREEVATVCSILSARSLDVTLLKGAARLYSRVEDAELHPAEDIDVLLRPHDVDVAVAALKAAGYVESTDARASAAYRAHHHHATPMYHPDRSVPIELHVSLAPPGSVSLPLDWDALAQHMRWVDGSAGRVRCLDPVATALHLAVHGIGVYRLRDCVALARLLKNEGPALIDKLDDIVQEERVEPIRLRAPIAIAAHLAGMRLPANADVQKYVEWVTRREDLPRVLRGRSQLVEAWYAAGRSRARFHWSIVAPDPWVDSARRNAGWRTAERIVAGLCALPFAALLPSSDGGRALR